MNELQVIRAIESNVEEALKFLIEQARKELKDQGHKLTGKLDRSFEAQVKRLSDDCISGKILHEDYGDSLDTGIPRRNVPFRRGSGAGSSKYIRGLIDFFKKRGKSANEARGLAFATAVKASKRTGHPTRPYYAGRKYSNNGRRTGWKSIAYSNANVNEFEKIMKLGQLLEELVFDFGSINKAA